MEVVAVRAVRGGALLNVRFAGKGEGVVRRIQGLEGGGGKAQGQEVGRMALTRDFKETVTARVARDTAFAKATAIFGVVRKHPGVDIRAHAVKTVWPCHRLPS